MGCGRLSLAPGGCGDRLAAHAVPHRDVVRAVLAEGAAGHMCIGFHCFFVPAVPVSRLLDA
jgi:hypothetical protein